MGRVVGVLDPVPTQELRAERERGGSGVKRKLFRAGTEMAVGGGE